MSESKYKKITPKTNTIFRGDNLEIMRAMPDESVDLVYIDPPFFTQRNYQNIWGDKESVADFESNFFDGFKDTRDFFEMHIKGDAKGLKAYLEWMRARIVECHRLLGSKGTFYLHLDYHAIHYVKVICDEIFGYSNFRSEVTWRRKRSSNSTAETPKSLSTVTDHILVYSKGPEFTFNMQYQAYDQEFIDKYYSQVDENGERYQSADLTSPSYRPNLIYTYKGYKPGKNGWAVSKEKMAEMDRQGRILFPKSKDGRLRRKNFLKDQKGLPINNLWLDIGNVQKESLEGTGWPTQKPVALLERVISLSSNEGDVVFDCFAGCGTSMHAAHNLKRKWIGIDISPTAIRVNKKRLEDIGAKVEVVDEKDLEVKLGHKSAQKNQKAA